MFEFDPTEIIRKMDDSYLHVYVISPGPGEFSTRSALRPRPPLPGISPSASGTSPDTCPKKQMGNHFILTKMHGF